MYFIKCNKFYLFFNDPIFLQSFNVISFSIMKIWNPSFTLSREGITVFTTFKILFLEFSRFFIPILELLPCLFSLL